MTESAAGVAEVLGALDPQVWLVTAATSRAAGGLIATFVARASIVEEAPRLILGVARHHRTWELIQASRAFCAHLLPPDRLDLVWRFGLHSGREGDKLAGLPIGAAPTGSPLVEGALAWLDCRVETTLETGDRTLYLARIDAGRLLGPGPPLGLRQMMASAPAEQIARMNERYAADGRIDAAAIAAWRSTRSA